MRSTKIANPWIIATCLISWIVTLLVFVGASIMDNDIMLAILPLPLFIAVILTLIAAIMQFKNLSSRDPRDERFTSSPAAKILAALIVIAIATSTYAAIKSLWYSPFSDNYSDRFVYENIATGVGFASLALIASLSAVQKDIYWVTYKKKGDLDERQLHERREIFESSYKIAALLVLITALLARAVPHNIPAILANAHNTVPAHLSWLPINLALALFALPLILAAWKKR